LERARRLEIGASEFLLHVAPTVGQLVDYKQNTYKCVVQAMACHPGNWVKVAHVQNAARTLVWQDYASSEAKGSYGRILSNKPNNVVRMMYKNFSSLSIFADGPHKHMKIHQVNKLASDYGIDLLSRCETKTDWHFVTNEESKYCNIFGDGQPTRGLCAFNTNYGNIKQDQWGGDLCDGNGALFLFCY
jgi:hypothetical protein